MKYTAPPYMYDVLPHPSVQEPWLHTARWRYVEGVFRDLCLRYGYREIRTPILESTELFTRSIGKESDIVSKEMFTFTDRGERSMTLKPEGTAPAVRACIEHGLFAAHPLLKLYYLSQNFRFERGQKGRYRQHQQLGIEAFGSDEPAIDAEVISLGMSFFRALGLSELTLHVNSVGLPENRARYLEALCGYVRPHLARMTPEGQSRFEKNPLRMLDTKNREELQILAEAPRLTDYLDAESQAKFEALQGHLTELNIPFVVDAALVRGFDYYTGTVFEIKSKSLGTQDTLCGGGRYNGLVEECGGPATPGIGFGLGIERCLLALDALGIVLPVPAEGPQVFIITPGEATRATAVKLLNTLREAGIAADMDYTGRAFRKQLKLADDLGARYVAILGDEEAARGMTALRDQATREQSEVPLEELAARLKAQQE